MLGRFEEATLFALVMMKGEATTTDISDVIARNHGKEPSYGALYTCLDRMEKKNFVSKRKGNPTPERGGKARFYYKITANGQQALNKTREIYQKFSSTGSRALGEINVI